MEDAEEFCIEDEADEDEKKTRPVIKNAMDLQRLKLEKLMKNPEKPIIIPEPPKEKDFMQSVPTFVRNVMGSSAGAGSGEFHVYRHLRRKEYARQKYIQAKSIREQLDDEYRLKLEKNKLEAEAKTAKRRAKRLKKKQKMKQKGKKRKVSGEYSKNDEESSSEDSESENEKDREQSDEGTEKEDVQHASQNKHENHETNEENKNNQDEISSKVIVGEEVEEECGHCDVNVSKPSKDIAEEHGIEKDVQCFDTVPSKEEIQKSDKNENDDNP